MTDNEDMHVPSLVTGAIIGAVGGFSFLAAFLLLAPLPAV